MLSVLAFSFKTGLGWAYLFLSLKPGRRLWPSLAIFFLYAAIFLSVMAVIRRINLLAHYQALSPLWENGLLLHWLVAAFIFLWGFALLRARPSPNPSSCHGGLSRGYLALILPCPVCLSVILMALACLSLYFPEKAYISAFLLFLSFVGLALISGLLLILGRDGRNLESSLGQAMMLIASYFMVSALIMPNFGSISRIYRLAAYGADQGAPLGNLPSWNSPSGLGLGLLSLGLALLGFLRARKKARLSMAGRALGQ
jgi:predicted transporter